MSVPKTRFKEFNLAWEFFKITEVADYVDYRGKTPTKTDCGVFLVTAKNVKFGFIDYNSSKEFVSDSDYFNIMSRGLPKIGDVLITTEAPLGNVANVDAENIALAQRIIKYRGKSGKINNYFLKQLFLSDKFQKLLYEKASGGTVKGIKGSVLHQLKINVPAIKEQQKIADFLTSVDEKINLLKKKKELLEQYKKGVMQKIFSQELRFKDEEGNDFPEWEEKMLGAVIIKNSRKNKSQEFSIVQSVSNKYGFINQDEYFEDRRIASKDTSNYYVIDKGTFAYNPSRIDVGSLAYKEDESISIISPLYISFYANNEFVNDVFLLKWFTSETFIKQMNVSFEGGVRNTLSFINLARIVIKIPCIKEQQKISDFLTALDDKIALVEQQINKTELWKKGLLQQMFV
ncbi:restriction endonuclease subunit S [Chryseobacterium sp. TY4]